MDETPDEPMALDDPPEHTSTPAPPNSSPSFLPTLLVPLLALIQPTELSFSMPSPHPPTTSALSAIHVAAFECLSNAFLALAAAPTAAATDAQVGRRVWAAVWAALAGAGNPADASRGSARAAVWDVAVGVLWGVGSIWPGKIVSVLDLYVARPRCSRLVGMCRRRRKRRYKHSSRCVTRARTTQCVSSASARLRHSRSTRTLRRSMRIAPLHRTSLAFSRLDVRALRRCCRRSSR